MRRRVSQALWRALGPALGLAILLAGCGTDTGDLQNYIADVKARPAQPIPPIPAVKTYTPYRYEGFIGRDPFQPSRSEEFNDQAQTGQGSGPRPDLERPREYLERFELDTLEMVGTFAQGDAYWGLIRDPDGVVHRVAVDHYLGKNHGRVSSIEPTLLTLNEFITDGAGGWLQREASLALEGSQAR
jgi:type IV pilus assembly protein PilP